MCSMLPLIDEFRASEAVCAFVERFGVAGDRLPSLRADSAPELRTCVVAIRRVHEASARRRSTGWSLACAGSSRTQSNDLQVWALAVPSEMDSTARSLLVDPVATTQAIFSRMPRAWSRSVSCPPSSSARFRPTRWVRAVTSSTSGAEDDPPRLTVAVSASSGQSMCGQPPRPSCSEL
jgi:hypothetical protein